MPIYYIRFNILISIFELRPSLPREKVSIDSFLKNKQKVL